MDGFPDALYSLTKNGWMDTDAFVSFLEHLVSFAKSKAIKFPILLFVDGHSTHMSHQASEYCHANGVVLYCLPPNATHIVQACDIGLFAPMKSSWKKAVKEWQMSHIGEVLSKKDFPTLFKVAWDQVATAENASSAFRRLGLFPLSPEGINKSKLGPSKLVAKCNPSTSPDPRENQAVVISAPMEAEVHCMGAYVEVGQTTDDQSVFIPPTCNGDSLPDNVDSDSGCVSGRQHLTSPSVLRDHEYVSPAFRKLKVPEPKQKDAKTASLREKLPKALSGSEALKVLREREERKKAEEIAKEKRKREREEKKRQKIADAEKKKNEREEKKRQRQILSKQKKTKKGKSKKRLDASSSESEAENEPPYMDDDSDDFEEEFDVCPKCLKLSAGHPSDWIMCGICMVRWHIRCADRPEFLLLDEEGRKDVEFLCPDCC